MILSRRAAAYVTMLVLIAAGAAWLSSGQVQMPAGEEAAPMKTAASTPPSSPEPLAAADGTTTRLVDLPPIGTPVGDVAATLRAAADAGDARAACRLGLELLRCRSYVAASRYFSDPAQWAELVEDASKRPRDGRAERLQRMVEDMDACRAVPADLLVRGGAYLRQAALAGEPEAMIRYAGGESLLVGLGLGFLRDPALDAWRREAPVVLRRAFAAGMPEAAYLLEGAYRQDPMDNLPAIAWLLQADPRLAHAHHLLQRRLYGDDAGMPARRTPPGLDADDLARADALAERWHRQYFDGRRVPYSASFAMLAPLADPAGLRPAGDAAPGWCGSPAARR